MQGILVGALLAVILGLASCGADPQTSGDPSACEPSTELTVVTDDLVFDADCYAAPADTPFSVTLVNDDVDPHAFSLYHDDGTPILKGPFVESGQQHTQAFEPLEAGTYLFRCDIHPEMEGMFEATA